MERRLREQRGIAIGLGLSFAAGVDAPAVTNDENNRFFRHECGSMGQVRALVKMVKELARQLGGNL
jgi:hypothetical protein